MTHSGFTIRLCLSAGPLVFSLPLDGQWSELKRYSEQSADWQITPAGNWNYAVELGQCDTHAVEHVPGYGALRRKESACVDGSQSETGFAVGHEG